MSDQEKVRIEESYFDDDKSFQELEIIEDELVDNYVRGQLSAAEREHFEKLLRSSARLSRRVQFARMLANRIGQQSGNPAINPVAAEITPVMFTGKQSWWQKIFDLNQPGRKFAIAGSAVIVLIIVGLLFGWMQLRESSRRLQNERAALQQQRETLDAQSREQTSKLNQLAADLEKERNLRAEDQKLIESLGKESGKEEAVAPTFASLFLSPGTSRDTSATGQTLNLRPAQKEVRLFFSVGDEYKTYEATIINQDGNEIVNRGGLKPRQTRSGKQIILQFPVARISDGSYVVRVSGQTPTGAEAFNNYAFHVVRAR